MMKNGHRCAVCALPVIDEVVRRRRAGTKPAEIHAWLVSQGFETTRAQLAYCLKAAAHHGPMPPPVGPHQVANSSSQLAALLFEAGIDQDLASRARKITVRGPKGWQGFLKTPDGTPETVDLAAKPSVTLTLVPEWEGPQWVPVQPAQRVTIRCGALPKVERAHRTAVVLPDIQFGFRRIDGHLEPFHDERALAVALELVRRTRPDTIVLLGDTLDLVEQSRYADSQHPTFALTTQAALDACHAFLATLRALCDGPIVWIEGNHDRRLEAQILRDARICHGLRPAGTAPDSWPVLSIPHLLRLDELGVTYLSGYPAVVHYLPDSDIACVHGERVRSNGSTAAAVVGDEADVSLLLFGHVHRRELHTKTRRSRLGNQTTTAASPGCLCRTDGAVPSMHGGTDVLGRPISRAENWQQGVAVVSWEPGTDRQALELVAIDDGTACFRGDWISTSG